MEKAEFGVRLAKLRENKHRSARDMSLSLGFSENYINGIENGHNYPAMAAFFNICETLGVTPKEFFDTESTAPTKANELLEIAKSLPPDQLDTLIALAKGLKSNK